jgi:glutaredoxin
MTRTIVLLGAVLLLGCGPEKPPAPDRPAGVPTKDAVGGSVYFEPGVAAVLTFAGARGAFKDAKAVDDVPEEARGLVRVVLLDGERAPADSVWVTNLKKPEGEKYLLRTVPRDLFEELAVGEGRSSEVKLPDGLEAPEVIQRDGIIVYKTSWCGVCKKVEAYLDRKGVKYVSKDIEKDREAAAELQAKAKEQGVKTGSVPVIDVGGELLVGFNRKRLEELLG